MVKIGDRYKIRDRLQNIRHPGDRIVTSISTNSLTLTKELYNLKIQIMKYYLNKAYILKKQENYLIYN